MDKNQLRQKYRALRSPLKTPVRDRMLFETVHQSPAYQQAKTVLFYVSTAHEPDTLCLIQSALDEGKSVAVPAVIRGTRQMQISYITAMSDLESGCYEILEPKTYRPCPLQELDLILVPAICFDLHGHRLGYGAGFYDRFLPQTSAVTMGLCYEGCLLNDCAHQPHDVPVDFIATEQRLIAAIKEG